MVIHELTLRSKILFEEKQKFTQWWLWIILLAPLVLFLCKSIYPLFFEMNDSSGNFSLSIAMPQENWIVLIISFLILFFFFFSALITRVDTEGIRINHLLFFKRDFLWKDIKSAEIVKYPFVGYGIRISLNHGTVYNVKGNKGLLLKFKNGKKRLIGTQKHEELKKVVTEILS